MSDRNWRQAKPKWVVEAAEAEMAEFEKLAALSWPPFELPKPVPFRWVDPGVLIGEPVAGEYWRPDLSSYAGIGVTRLKVALVGGRWITHLAETEPSAATPSERGPIYATKAEAIRAGLWDLCERFAAPLARARRVLREAENE